MKKIILLVLIVVVAYVLITHLMLKKLEVAPIEYYGKSINLPPPRHTGNISIEEAILNRRSIRNYADEPLTLAEVSQLLWAAQGITSDWGGRTTPSAGSTYPLEVYLVAGKVEGITPGVYHYDSNGNFITKVLDGDLRGNLSITAVGQEWIKNAPVDLLLTAFYNRTTNRYGQRGVRYVHMEAGHAAENVYLQAVSLQLGTVSVGAFSDEQVKGLLNLSEDETPLYIMPVGRPTT